MFDLLLPFAQQHTFKASSWGEEAQQTLAKNPGFSPQSLTVLGIHALNHDNFQFFKYCMENGGNIRGLTASEMESYFQTFDVYRQTFLDRIEPYYNENFEDLKEFIPYYRPYCFRSNPNRLKAFILMGGHVFRPLFRLAFTSKGRRYQPEPSSLLRLNPYDINQIPVYVWRKVFEQECFYKNGKPKTAILRQFHRLIFSYLFTRYLHKPSPISDVKRNVPNPHDARHFIECHPSPYSSIVHLFKTPPLEVQAWHSPEEGERVFGVSFAQDHFKSLIQVFNDNHQWHHQHGHAIDEVAIEFRLQNSTPSSTLNHHHETLLIAAACHTFSIPFDFSTINPIELEDVLIFEKFIQYEQEHGVFSKTGERLLQICLFNLMLERPELFHMQANTRTQKSTEYLRSFLEDLPLFYPLMFPGVSLEHKLHHLCHQADLTVLISVFEKICEELKNDFDLMEYANLEDEIKELCALFDEDSNPSELLQQHIKQLQSLHFPPIDPDSFPEEPDDGSVLFGRPEFLMTDNSRHGANLRYLCLQYAALRSQLLSLMKSAEKSRLQAVFQHLHRLYPNHKITQSIHCVVLQKHVRSAHASSQKISETSRF